MTQVSDYKLKKHDQVDILNQLIAGLEVGPNSLHQQIFAVIGERGWGKSTILHVFREILERKGSETEGGKSSLLFVVTPILDASIISEEVGIFGAVMHELHEACKNKLVGIDMTHLKKVYDNLCADIIRQQTTYKIIAKEMAMSTDHYVKIMLDWHKQSKNVSETFDRYTAELLKAFGRAKKTPTFVIFLDDLDMADHDILHVWVRNILGWFKDSPFQAYWVLSFEMQRFIKALSPERFVEGHKKALDLAIGRSWMNKLVASQRQFTLLPWSSAERMSYQPFIDGLDWKNTNPGHDTELKETETLLGLLKSMELTNFITALPDFPRGLNSLYYWLLRRKVNADPMHNAKLPFLEKIADTNGVLPQYRRLALGSPFARLRLPSAYVNWREDILSPILASDPLRLVAQDAFENAEIYIEQLCDSDLSLKFDLRRLFSITDQLDFFKDAHAQFTFSNTQLITRHFWEYSPGMGAALVWSAWLPEKQGSGFSLHTGPRVFWESLFLNDKHQVHTMLSHYLLNSPTLGLDLDVKFEAARTHLDFMPQNLRGLLLLIDKLASAPWLELSLAHKFWSPLTVVTCSAAFYVSAMAGTIWPEMKSSNPLYWPRHSFAKVKQLDDGAVRKHFTSLLKELPKSRYPSDGDATPLDLARRELFRAFGRLLELGAVRQLVQP